MKKIFWIVMSAGVVGIMGWFSYVSVQPRAIPKIKLSPFETPRVAANSIWLRLQEEFRASPIWLWGLNPGDLFQQQILTSFLMEAPGNAPSFTEIWLDQELGLDVPQKTRLINFKENPRRVAQELEEVSRQGKHVLLVTATPYAAAFLAESPAWKMSHDHPFPFFSLLFADFPRRRADENNVTFPCVLPHVDANGIGALGCQIQQRARLWYRKSMTSGSRVGILDQISGHDFLFLVAIEP